MSCAGAMEGLEQSTLSAKVELQSFKSLKMGAQANDFSPISPAQGAALLMFALELFVEGRTVAGGWALFASRCAPWLCLWP